MAPLCQLPYHFHWQQNENPATGAPNLGLARWANVKKPKTIPGATTQYVIKAPRMSELTLL